MASRISKKREPKRKQEPSPSQRWQLQAAKAQFSEVFRRAREHAPQVVTKRGKDAVVSEHQISAFPTKNTPVYKVKFTGMNLVLAGGAYMG